jgi:predicted dehydrogenase
MEKIKFALVGCGNIAKKHSHVISNFLGNAEIRCFCDKELSRAEKFGRKHR